jgi:hypothetical protein
VLSLFFANTAILMLKVKYQRSRNATIFLSWFIRDYSGQDKIGEENFSQLVSSLLLSLKKQLTTIRKAKR